MHKEYKKIYDRVIILQNNNYLVSKRYFDNNNELSDNIHRDYSITSRTLNDDEVFVPINEAQKPKRR